MIGHWRGPGWARALGAGTWTAEPRAPPRGILTVGALGPSEDTPQEDLAVSKTVDLPVPSQRDELGP